MLKLNTAQQRLPLGGHHYHEYGVTFRGDTFQEVVEKLKSFRLNNNISYGDPEQEVLKFYASHWPYMVRTDREGTEKEEEPQDYQDWRKWTQTTWRNPPLKRITTREATDRWNACLGCKFNKPLDWEMSDESRELSRRIFILRRGLDAPSGVGYCSLHKCDLGVFGYIGDAEKYSTKNENEEQPKECWVGQNEDTGRL